MTTKLIKSRMKAPWIEMLFGESQPKEPESTETRAIDFVKDPKHSVQFKLEILAACIDILNEELND